MVSHTQSTLELWAGSSAGRHWGEKPSLKDNNLLSWYVRSWKRTCEQALFCTTLLPGNPCRCLVPGVRRILCPTHWLMERTSPAMLSPLHHSNRAQAFEVTAGSHLHVTTSGHPIILDFLSSQVQISQTLQYKNALNANESFNVSTAYILLFIKWLMCDIHSLRREELVDGYSLSTFITPYYH